MLARTLLIGFILEIVLVTLLVHIIGDVAWHLALFAAVALIVVVRIAIGLLSFVLAWWFRAVPPPQLRIDFWRVAILLTRETWALLKLFFVYHPLANWLDRLDPVDTDRHGPPVLLVHGFFSNGGFWRDVKTWLRQQGMTNLHTINLEPMFADIDHYAEQLGLRIDQVLSNNPGQRVTLVAHSMGGLVCRAYLARHGGGRVAQLITLGSPHHGTVHARILPGRNLQQMRPSNSWLDRLNANQDSGLPVPATSIFSYHDNIIAPQDSARLPNADNYPLAGLGHLDMAFAASIRRQLREALAVH